MGISETLVYLSAGCNSSPHCLAWGFNGVLLYASDANIVVCDPDFDNNGLSTSTPGFRAVQNLRNHSAAINCIRWVRDPMKPTDAENEFISLSSDKTCVVWSVIRVNDKPGTGITHEFAVAQYLECKAPLQVGKALYLPECHEEPANQPRRSLLALAGVDGSLTLWLRQDKVGYEMFDTLEIGRGQILDVDITLIPGTKSILLAWGGDDGSLHLHGLYVEGSAVQFEKLATMMGHEDWIRSVEFSSPDNHGAIHLLTTGQDCTIRLWSVRPENGTVESDDLWMKVNSRAVKVPGISTGYEIVYDTLLFGHEGWIYGAHWTPPIMREGSFFQPLRILSSSMDKTMILWEPQEDYGGIWTDTARMGEVGGNNLGFYGCHFSPDGSGVLAHSFSGSLHMWRKSDESNIWTPSVVTGGHFGAVNDISWDPRGLYLLSTSQDQTTRLHAPWVVSSSAEEWHEISRPQVHGYDLTCLASTGPFSFATGAEEKIVRHFQATKNFLMNFAGISKLDFGREMGDAAEGAVLPALGLSNKPVATEETKRSDDASHRHPTDRYAEKAFVPVKLAHPPPEEDLIQNTLWPETHKLYGHGYEISCLACNQARTLLASASRANHPEHAEIFLWSKVMVPQHADYSWTVSGRLAAHSLTVTQMAFSHSDQYLLSVSRDRSWALFQKASEGVPYAVCAKPDKATSQTRIIWTCCWTPDDEYFATGSRDKTVYVYHVGRPDVSSRSQLVDLVHRLSFNEAVTALDAEFFLGDLTRYLIGVGSDDGTIQLYSFDRAGTEEPSHVSTLTSSHHKTVNRIKFQPTEEKNSSEAMRLATAGTDRAVKIFMLRKC